MNPFFTKLLSPHKLEYMILNQNLVVLEFSAGAKRFALPTAQFQLAQDARLGFPELEIAHAQVNSLLAGQKDLIELKQIVRQVSEDYSLWFNLYGLPYSQPLMAAPAILMLLEDITELIGLQRSLQQGGNLANLLVDHLSVVKNYHQKLLDFTGNILLITTPDGTIKGVNKMTELLLDFAEQELIGTSIFQVIDAAESLKEISQEALQVGGLSKKIEVTCQTKTQQTIILEFTCLAIATESQGLHDLIYMGWDITERKKAEEELRNALAKERELNDLRYRFISIVSHEFRTPLTTIVSSAELLEYYAQENLEEARKRHLKLIQDAANYICLMLDDLLVLEKAEVGKKQIHLLPLDIEQLCQNLAAEMQILSQPSLEINFEKSGNCQIFELDEELINQILTNLLSNAIKYSPEGGKIQFRLDCQPERLVFEIQDPGIGIPPEDIPHIFESFHRAKNVSHISGTGLGLAIVQKAVELHGGKIEVNSKVNGGTTFTVILPLLQGDRSMSLP